MKLTTKEQAELFAAGFEKGRKAGIAHARKAYGNQESRISYARKRVATLARWRRYAIDRLGIGPKIVAEIDRDSKRAQTVCEQQEV